eukprot:TRINITY_DN5485_c0_g1_i1.p1 TRINITY_DN5485_c0_g1~~TRINITY_DN5485_c0_g1_i1.p1  ORF type:complete len:547 (-),score=96.50 TRINITY_DN5485_c0_g1_i1:78-1685(-)
MTSFPNATTTLSYSREILRSNVEPYSQRPKTLELSDRIFANRDVRLDRITTLGFDLDFTLALYRIPAYDQLTFELLRNALVDKLGYPAALREIEFDPNFIVRGVVLDKIFGNILKLDMDGNIVVGYHGLTRLSKKQISEIYSGMMIHRDQVGHRYVLMNTSFDIPKAYIFAVVVQHIEGIEDGEKPSVVQYEMLWTDVLKVTGMAHSGSLKSVLLESPEKYTHSGDRLCQLLSRLRESGKKLFLLTNSPWYYTDGVMQYLLSGKLPKFSSWLDYFDVVIVNATKPAFFLERNPFREVNPKTSHMSLAAVNTLERGKVYSYGNLHDFQRMMGVQSGPDVLYVGDHVFSDVMISKKKHGWRTLLIIPELEKDLQSLHSVSDVFSRLAAAKLFKLELWESTDPNDPGCPDLTALKQEVQALKQQLNDGYNLHFGGIFRHGERASFFAMQVGRYADLYTTNVLNLLNYSMNQCFVTHLRMLPHEIVPLAPTLNGNDGDSTSASSFSTTIPLSSPSLGSPLASRASDGTPPSGGLFSFDE